MCWTHNSPDGQVLAEEGDLNLQYHQSYELSEHVSVCAANWRDQEKVKAPFMS